VVSLEVVWLCLPSVSWWLVLSIFVDFPFFLVTAEFNAFSCLSATGVSHGGIKAAALTRRQYVNRI